MWREKILNKVKIGKDTYEGFQKILKVESINVRLSTQEKKQKRRSEPDRHHHGRRHGSTIGGHGIVGVLDAATIPIRPLRFKE